MLPRMSATPSQITPTWLAVSGTALGSGAILMACWQVANLTLGWVAGTHAAELECIVQISAASGVIAALATLPLARRLLRAARGSVALSVALLPVGLLGVYCLVPRVFAFSAL